jgi:hypothetical protein
MPRPSNNLTIAQIESMLHSRRSQLATLSKDRAKLLKQLESVDAKIKHLSGGAPVKGGFAVNAAGRARNSASLISMMMSQLQKAGKALSVSDILQGVQSAGYRSTSPNFRGIVNQTLIKERKRFSNVGRGMYQLKK